ncbi:hypothetical protein [Pseudomonas sp. NPDC089569]|uniref:hypothetical protein n=1 Tax=Pseudomonas sp. NPDC089569 TaxID=3390722 RepID=UPI003D052404
MYSVIGLVLLGLALYLLLKAKAPAQIFQLFRLSEVLHELVGSDLGRGHPRRRIGALGVGGEPDAIFRVKRSGQIIIGEYKNRKYKGYVRRREFYQVTLYLGLAAINFKTQDVVGLLAYNDQCIEIAYDQELFEALIGLRREVLTSMHKKRAQDSRPLHRRRSVTPRNRKIRFEGH